MIWLAAMLRSVLSDYGILIFYYIKITPQFVLDKVNAFSLILFFYGQV